MENETPSISEKTRTVVYFVLLGVSAIALAVHGFSDIWFNDDIAQKVGKTADVTVSVLSVIAGGLGVVYRPTLSSGYAGKHVKEAK